jgi:hypothetical protein
MPRLPRAVPLLSVVWVACGPGPDAGSAGASAEAGQPASPVGGSEAGTDTPDEGPLPELRTGTLDPIVDDLLHAKVIDHAKTDRHAFLELELPTGDPERVAIEGLEGALAVPTRRGLIVRRLADGAWPETISGSVWTSRWEEGIQRWHRAPFQAPSASTGSPDEALPGRFDAVFPLGNSASGRGSHPFHAFARARLRAMRSAGGAPGVDLPVNTRPPRQTEFAELMGTVTAAMSLQESLQHERGLRMRTADAARTIPVTDVSGPTLRRHPFEDMRRAIPDAKPAAEPLAELAPADFWYLRFDDIRLMLRTLDEVDAWVTPVAQVLQERAELKDLTGRMQRQLGMRRTRLAKTLGHAVVSEVAAVGSDPYLREGSDVTLIFQVSQKSVFDGELSGHLEHWGRQVGPLTRTETRYHDHAIVEHADAARQVRQQRVDVGDKVLISNSANAIRRVLDAIDGRSPTLASQADLQYLLARDPGEHQAVAFLSDAFIESVIGPEQKIAEARRLIALSELLGPGYAALLHGWVEGAPPQSTEALIASKLMDRSELVHGDGSPIDFRVGTPARSTYGTAADLTPLIDLPRVTTVSVREKRAYEAFSRGYQRNWSTFVDPVAITLDIAERDGAQVATVGARILPLIEATDYDDIRDVVGDQRVKVAATKGAVQAVWAVGADTRLRRQLDGMAKSFSPDGKLSIGWLGDWVAIGSLDRNAVLDTTWFMFDEVQLPRERKRDADGDIDRDAESVELARRAGQLPVYAMADVGNPASLVATLGAIKGLATSVAPGMVDWSEHARHGDVPIVRVGISATASDREMRQYADLVSIFYAQAGGAIIVSLREDVLRGLIDRAMADELPRGTDKDAAPQFVLDGEARAGGPLWTAAAWTLQAQARRAQESARTAAEVVLRGAPATASDPTAFARIARAYLGNVPMNAAGGTEWVLSPHGAGDATSGSTIAPAFGVLPTPGSPLETLMKRLTGLRGEIAFDREPGPQTPPAHSLRTRFDLRLNSGG